MSAVATPQRAATRPAAQTEKTISDAVKLQVEILTDALYAAWQTDEPNSYSGDSSRLLRCAYKLVEDLPNQRPDPNEVVSTAYDVAALLNAAQVVPGDKASAARKAHIAKASAAVIALADDAKAMEAWILPGNHGEAAFMEGKAVAALMVREATRRKPNEAADLNASYRDDDQPQDNFTAPFLQLLLKEQHLLPGFTAALSSMLAEADFSGSIADGAAEISYSACTTFRTASEYEDFNAYTAPSLDEQMAYYALEDLVTTSRPGEITGQVASLDEVAEEQGPLTGDTPITKGGAVARNLVSWCSFDIEYLAGEITLLGEECTAEGQNRLGALLRCYGVRIGSLNSVLMSFLTDDEISLQHAHRAIYRGAKKFDPKEFAHD